MSKENPNSDDYWSFTAAFTDIDTISENLKVIIEVIDSKADYSNRSIQEELSKFNNYGGKDPLANARKIINTCVKLGLIEPIVKNSKIITYHPSCKKFINSKGDIKVSFLSDIFYENNKIKSSITENKDSGKVNKIKFLIKTLETIKILDKDHQFALMKTDPDDPIYKDGFISRKQLDELIEKMKGIDAYREIGNKKDFYPKAKITNFSDLTIIQKNTGKIIKLEKSNDFERFKHEKKVQRGHLFNFVNLFNFVSSHEDNLISGELIGKTNLKSNNTSVTRPGQGPYRNKLVIESIKHTDLDKNDKGICMSCGLDINVKKLVASHIWPWVDCPERCKDDSDNGLLLGENRDYFFNYGKISYSSEGSILYEKINGDIQISENWRHVLQNEKIDQVFLTDRRKKYLTIHRMDNGFQEKDDKLYNSLCEQLSK